MKLYYDNMSAINIFKNYIQCSTAKHIDICHHLIMELVEEKKTTIDIVRIYKQNVNIFTKAFDVIQFENLQLTLGLCVINL